MERCSTTLRSGQRWRRGYAEAQWGQELGRQLLGQVEDHESIGAELARQLDLASELLRAGQLGCADARIDGNLVVDRGDLAANPLGEVGISAFVVHRAHEIQVAGLNPGLGILTYDLPRAFPVAKDCGGDL